MEETNRSDLNVLLSDLFKDKNRITKFENYADRLLYRKSKFAFARHLTPSDIIASVCSKLLNGDIIWDEDKETLIHFFSCRIRSEISNLIKRERKFMPVPLEPPGSCNDYSGELDNDITDRPEYIINPIEDNDDEKEDEYAPEEIKNVALEIFKDSAEEFLVLDGIYRGLQSRQIALDLGISKDDVHNIKKRIKRVLMSWVKRNKAEKENIQKLKLIENNKPPVNLDFENKPGKSTPDTNNNGELI